MINEQMKLEQKIETMLTETLHKKIFINLNELFKLIIQMKL